VSLRTASCSNSLVCDSVVGGFKKEDAEQVVSFANNENNFGCTSWLERICFQGGVLFFIFIFFPFQINTTAATSAASDETASVEADAGQLMRDACISSTLQSPLTHLPSSLLSTCVLVWHQLQASSLEHA
jgi:hypothetical protein